MNHQVYKAILTTTTAASFYLKRGYVADFSYTPKNHDPVYTKLLK